ncbi:hypothetical protein PC9H_001104 [Pleurotus ostreatus]|uniref:Uncharacterized protein n=1 Tax=Pleurotus ostreatus TaxID=5322 RepID=A0A8H7A6A6_PLEOS|nr:uncharacterized protein PC9H_001104 [Pleurotus ostreatus]KAF7440756.1 hypothetical protein PC9H_001104 [Pleurotus ostreatus]
MMDSRTTSEILKGVHNCADIDSIILHAFSIHPPKLHRGNRRRLIVRTSSRLRFIKNNIHRRSGISPRLKQLRVFAGGFKRHQIREYICTAIPGRTQDECSLPPICGKEFKATPSYDGAHSKDKRNQSSPAPRESGQQLAESLRNTVESSNRPAPETLRPSTVQSMTNRRLALNKPALQHRLTLSALCNLQHHASPDLSVPSLSPDAAEPITPINQVIHTPLQPPEIPRAALQRPALSTASSPLVSALTLSPRPNPSKERSGSPLSPLCDLANALSLLDSPCATISRRLSYFSTRRLSQKSPSSSRKLYGGTLGLVLASPLILRVPLHSPLLTPTPSFH